MPSSTQVKASWIFGTLLLIFLLGVFLFGPDSLSPFKQRILTYICALLAALFATFITGSLLLNAELPIRGKWAVKGGAGFALFLIVLFWWNSAAAPIKKSLSVEEQRDAIAKHLDFLCNHASLYNPMSWEIRKEVYNSIDQIRSETGRVLGTMPTESRATEPLKNMQRAATQTIHNPAIFPQGKDTGASPIDDRFGPAVPQGIAEFRTEFAQGIDNLESSYGLQGRCDLEKQKPLLGKAPQ